MISDPIRQCVESWQAARRRGNEAALTRTELANRKGDFGLALLVQSGEILRSVPLRCMQRT